MVPESEAFLSSLPLSFEPPLVTEEVEVTHCSSLEEVTQI